MGGDCPRSREGKNMLEVSFLSLLTEREEEIIIFSVLLAEEQSGLPRFACNDGYEVTGFPSSLAMTGMRSLDSPLRSQ